MSLEDKLEMFIAEYSERACMLLKAIYEESKTASGLKLGDFSVKGVKNRLKSWGIEYNPVPLLMKLEKEIGVIETSYRSTNQRWWHILDMEALGKALEICGMKTSRSEDPRIRLIRLQFHVLNPHQIVETLKKIQSKRAPSKGDAELLRRMAFKELPLLLKLKEEVESLGYIEELQDEIEIVNEIMGLAEKLIIGSMENTTRTRLRERIEPTGYTGE